MEEQAERIDVTLSRSTRVSDEGMRVYASVIKVHVLWIKMCASKIVMCANALKVRECIEGKPPSRSSFS